MPPATQSNGEIQRLNAQLAAANQELEALSYSISHDLRTPLRHILGYADILQTGTSPTLDKTSRRHLQTIAQSAAQMDQMIDGLAEFSRLGRVEMRCQRVSLAALVEDVCQALRGEIKDREIDWQIGDLPEVQADPVLLRQAIVNLLSNAVKFTRPRTKARIEIGSKNDGRETIFFVRDNGVGFDLNCAARLFGAFQRFHRPGEFEGTGLGLANVRRIIQRHAGRTWAEAKAEGGATFYFSIPNPSGEGA